MKATVKNSEQAEGIPVLSTYPISFHAKTKIIETLQGVFKGKKMRSNQLSMQGAHWYGGKKSVQREIGILFKGPFENYVSAADNWDEFLGDLFTRLRTFYTKYFEDAQKITDETVTGVVFNIRHPRLDCINGKMVALKYFDAIEWLTRTLIKLMGNNCRYDNTFFFQDFHDKHSEIVTLFSDPVFEFLDFRVEFHVFFMQMIMNYFLEENSHKIVIQSRKIQLLENEVARLKHEKKHSTASLRTETKNKTQTLTTSALPDTRLDEQMAENTRLLSILSKLWYNLNEQVSPEEWITQKEKEAIQSKDYEWESMALEEANRSKLLEKDLSEKSAYIVYLEDRLKGSHEMIAEKYKQERWEKGLMDIGEMMSFLANNPKIAKNALPDIIETFEQLVRKVGGWALSSTGNADVWIWSGHMANIVLLPLINFIKEHLKNGDYAYLELSWKQIIENYILEAGWHNNEGDHSVFTALFNNLQDIPGNISNIDMITTWLRTIETKYHADLRWLCKIIWSIFFEHMQVLSRKLKNVKR